MGKEVGIYESPTRGSSSTEPFHTRIRAGMAIELVTPSLPQLGATGSSTTDAGGVRERWQGGGNGIVPYNGL